MITIRLSPENARLLAQNIDGWMDAGAGKDGLTPKERNALDSAYNQIMRQLVKERSIGRTLCEVFSGKALTQPLASPNLKEP